MMFRKSNKLQNVLIMVSIFDFTHRFKRSMLEIISDIPIEFLWNYLNPLQKEKLPANILFRVVAGKKAYDIIRLYESGENFYSRKVIDVLSQFIDMSDKCYPIDICGIKEQYYVIYNLNAYSFLNREEELFMYDPRFFEVSNGLQPPLFGVKGTKCIMVSEEVKNALLKNKISNIELIEGFGCTQEEYEEIKRTKFQPKVHVFRDK